MKYYYRAYLSLVLFCCYGATVKANVIYEGENFRKATAPNAEKIITVEEMPTVEEKDASRQSRQQWQSMGHDAVQEYPQIWPQQPRYYPYQHVGYPPELLMPNGLRVAADEGGAAPVTMMPENVENPTTNWITETTAQMVTTTEAPVVVGAQEVQSSPKPTKSDLMKLCLAPTGEFASPYSCKRYISCWYDQVFEMECPFGTAWNNVYNFCDHIDSKYVNCPAQTQVSLSGAPYKCEMPFGTFGNPNNCSEFYICSWSMPVKLACPEDTHFNEAYKTCDFKYRAGCTDSSMAKSSVHKTIHAKVADCIPYSVARLNEDCSKVSVCDARGFSKIYNCPLGLAYDINSSKCIDKKVAFC